MKNYCPDLFVNLFVQKANENQVQLGHCCVSKLTDPVDNIDFHHDFLEANRKWYLENDQLPESCSHCIRAESQGGRSRRTAQITSDYQPKEFRLERLDYNCDNICNLKCIMCSSYYSSSWIEDEIKLGKRVETRIKPTKHNNLIYQLDASKIRHIYFNGGEPLMTRDHMNVLHHIIEHGDPENCMVYYSSNGTFGINPELQDTWRHFQRVNLGFSIDAAFEPYEYIRHPGIWSEVSNNLLQYRQLASDQFRQSIQVTIGIHNVLYFDQLYDWATQHNYDVVLQGDTLGINGLSLTYWPLKHLDYLMDYLNQLPESVAKQTLLNMSRHILTPEARTRGVDVRWIPYLDSLDKIRGNNWRVSLSRLANLTGY